MLIRDTLRVPLVAALCAALSASAQAEDFYAGKQINLIVGSAPGGGYDANARLVARHLGKFIAGEPSVVVQNLPAAGSLVAMNSIANTVPSDGLTIGAVQNHIGVEPIIGATGPTENARYDSRKMNWLASTSKAVPVVVAWSNSPINTFQDTMKQEVMMGASGVATADTVNARLLNNLAGTKFKIITGYKSNPEIVLAAETGEIAGRAGWFVSAMMATNGGDVASGHIRVLVQLATEKHPALPNVPLITQFITDKTAQEEMAFALSWFEAGQPFVAPPGVPADRVKVLRDAFMAMVKSAEFLAEAKRLQLDVSPMAGEQVQQMMERLYATPQPVIDRVRQIILTQ